MSHSFIAPSSAEMWVKCAGMPLMSSMYPQESTPEAMEGEASHWVVAHMLTKGAPLPQAGDKAPNGVVLSDEMIECAFVMIDDVKEKVSLASDLHIEESMPIKRIHDQCFGTPDAWLFNGSIHLWDYKYGHKDVPADSWQNITYVAGILDLLKVDDQTTNVVMTIVQPRSFSPEGPIKRFKCKASDLRAEFNMLAAQAEKAFTPDPGVQSGSHCRYCPARHACPAARSAASSAVDYAGSALPEDLDADALSFELALLERGMKAIEHRYEAIKTMALSMIEAGGSIPGYGIKNGLGHRKFVAPPEEIFALGDLLGIDTRAELTTISPAEFDRRLAAVNKQRKAEGHELIDKSVISAYIDRPSTGMKLVPSDETLAIKAFKL